MKNKSLPLIHWMDGKKIWFVRIQRENRRVMKAFKDVESAIKYRDECLSNPSNLGWKTYIDKRRKYSDEELREKSKKQMELLRNNPEIEKKRLKGISDSKRRDWDKIKIHLFSDNAKKKKSEYFKNRDRPLFYDEAGYVENLRKTHMDKPSLVKEWHIRSPTGKIYRFFNLRKFCRENENLFDGTPWKTTANGINHLHRAPYNKSKSHSTHYKGWTIVSNIEKHYNSRDLLGRVQTDEKLNNHGNANQ